MDRLVVGDVGFGKTEIAIRAARHAAENNKQVALLAPTTLLVQQHFDSFRQRLPALWDQIGVLSRFSSPAKVRATKANIASNRLKIIVGTHALLGPSVAWADLGLVIIDEEQRFGVSHKEHFKKIRAELDMLSLSATPIPRTLSMALSSLKQLSVIATAPEGRQDITTHVGSDNDDVIKHAIATEHARGGQVYVVAPRVRALGALATRIRRLLPNLSIAIAHGQLNSRDLAQTIQQFNAGQLDVLVSSSIVEHGLDLPRANTIIVCEATHFGLADLYQLRGRIGRRNIAGFAYFLYTQSMLTNLQRERLVALTEASRLGSGWLIARRDLELRGAGNLLGAEQSGSVNDIGIQLYLDMVRTASEQSFAATQYQDVEIRLPLPALLPEHYIADPTERARMYQLLARARNPAQLLNQRQVLVKNFGPLPPESANLCLLLKLQHLAARANIRAITGTMISPPGTEPFLRLTLQTKNPAEVLPAVSVLGPWQTQGHALHLDIPSLTPDFVRRLATALAGAKH